jgi:uncharacterized membrane protein
MKRKPSLEARVERLERMVEEIHRSLGLESPPAAAPVPAPAEVEAVEERRADAWARYSEQWLGRIGLGLLFLGLVYLFNYSIEQGWITPAVRVAIGLVIATVLLVFGLRIERRRRSYSQLLLAGALAVYYVSGFAANQLYLLVSHGLAFAYMAAVMVLALVLARRQDRPSLASLGALGGLATPLLLHRESAAVMELSVYGALVIGWAAALYWLRGWPSLLWTYAVGGLATLGIAASHAEGGERVVVQAALLLAWLLGAALPFARGVLRSDRRSQRYWGVVPIGIQLRVLGVGVTSAVLFLTDRMWALSDDATGLLFLVGAVVYGAAAWVGTRTPNRVGRAAAPVAAALCATGSYLVLPYDPVKVAVLAVEAFLFVQAGRGRRFAGVEWVGHTLFGALVIHFLGTSTASRRAAFDALAFAQLLEIGLMVAASWLASPAPAAWAYRVTAHLLFLLWLAWELGPLTTGTGLVTAAWGAYGALLLLLSLRLAPRAARALQLVAYSALGLAVLKLFIVDLQRMAMLWRVLLFMGFGGALLGLSSLFKPRDEAAPEG